MNDDIQKRASAASSETVRSIQTIEFSDASLCLIRDILNDRLEFWLAEDYGVDKSAIWFVTEGVIDRLKALHEQSAQVQKANHET